MKLRAQNPPHIRTRESHQTLMVDAIIAMLPLYAMAAYFYGMRAVMMGMFSVAATVILDTVCVGLRHSVPNIRDHSAVVTGMLIPLLMPASVRFEVVFVAALFAMAVVKHPFGGVGQNVFNPAAAGVAFATVCFPRSMFLYPAPFEALPTELPEGLKLLNSPGYTLALGGVPTNDPMDMLLGNFPGPMGATNILVLITCLLFLSVRKSVSFRMTAAYIAGFSAVAAAMPRAMLDPLLSVYYELVTGIALISAVFLINDPVTSPRRKSAKLIYGFLTGALCMLLRRIGRYEESILFALLIMNASVWIIDMAVELAAHLFRRSKIEAKRNKEISQAAEADEGAD